MEIQAFSGVDGLMALEADWRRLAQMSDHYFHDFAWFLEYFKHGYSSAADARIIVLKDGGRAVGILPLEHRTERIRRIPTPIWATMSSRRGDILMFASSSDFLTETPSIAEILLDGAVNYLRTTHPKLPLLLVGKTLPHSGAEKACSNYPGLKHYYKKSGINWFDLSRPYTELVTKLSPNFRANLRKANKRAGAVDKLSLSLDYRCSSEFEKAYSDFKQLEAAGWKGKTPGGSALTSGRNDSQLRFLDNLYLFCNTGCDLFVARAMLGDICISALLGWKHKATVAVPKIAYNEDYSRMSPGNLLIGLLFEHFCSEPEIQWGDLMADAAWHHPWKPKFQEHRWCYIPLSRIRGNALVHLMNLSA